MATKSPENMTVEELEAFLHYLDEQKQEIREKQLDVHFLLDTKNAEAAALVKVEGLSPLELAALRQAVEAAPIASEEAAGSLGG